jgi:hypothetical protein
VKSKKVSIDGITKRIKIQRTIIVPRTFSSNHLRFNCSPTGNNVSTGVSSVVLLVDLELLLDPCVDRDPGRREVIPVPSESGLWPPVVVVVLEANFDAPALRLAFEGSSTLSTDTGEVGDAPMLSGEAAKPETSKLDGGIDWAEANGIGDSCASSYIAISSIASSSELPGSSSESSSLMSSSESREGESSEGFRTGNSNAGAVSSFDSSMDSFDCSLVPFSAIT